MERVWQKHLLVLNYHVGADITSSTASTSERKQAGSIRQLGQMKRQKSIEYFAKNELGNVETHSSGEANYG